MASDMTKGNLTKQILVYALPICLGSIFQQFYNLADAIIVGRILGTDALAGVGSTTGLTFLIYSLANDLSNGFSVSVSQRFGAGNLRRVDQGLRRVMILAWTLTAFLITIAVFLGKYMIGWFIDPSETEVIRLGHQFLVSFVGGYGFLAVQLAYCFALQGIGLALPLAWIFTSVYLLPVYYLKRSAVNAGA